MIFYNLILYIWDVTEQTCLHQLYEEIYEDGAEYCYVDGHMSTDNDWDLSMK